MLSSVRRSRSTNPNMRKVSIVQPNDDEHSHGVLYDTNKYYQQRVKKKQYPEALISSPFRATVSRKSQMAMKFQQQDDCSQNQIGGQFTNIDISKMLLESFPSQKFGIGIKRLHQHWVTDNSTLGCQNSLPELSSPVKNKVLCIRLM